MVTFTAGARTPAEKRRDRTAALVRLLLVAIAFLLSVPAAPPGTYGASAARPVAPVAANLPGPSGISAPRTSAVAHDAEEEESVGERIQPRRSGRSVAAPSAPTPHSVPLPSSAPVRTAGGLALTAPLTARHAVPLTRSGELPVQHGVFRC
ncbi:hypothetical protein ACIBK8_20240 [Streptomyces sp. NPDC050161]|uniref:hypothetical protein n=1 Tax=Streptomyces sp. NPDC050161 TaxID=3365604 RepID=UPI0037B2836D